VYVTKLFDFIVFGPSTTLWLVCVPATVPRCQLSDFAEQCENFNSRREMCTQKSVFFALVRSIKKANNFVKHSARNCSNIFQLVAALFTSGRAPTRGFCPMTESNEFVVSPFCHCPPTQKSRSSVRRQVCFATPLESVAAWCYC
jgi:hypothetical protein